MDTCYLKLNQAETPASLLMSLGLTQPVDVLADELRIGISSGQTLHSQSTDCDMFINYNLASMVLLSQQLRDQDCTVVFTHTEEPPEIPANLANLINNIGFSVDIRSAKN